jgi:hypothetical protein
MWKKNTALLLILPLASVLLSPGCATLTRSKMQRIPVTSSPAGATVIVNGAQQGVTPLEIRLVRREKGQLIRIEAPGYNPFEIRTQRKISFQTILGNIVLGAGVAALAYGMENMGFGERKRVSILDIAGTAALFTIIDASSKKGYEFEPTDLIVTLTKADGPPRIETMYIDTDDFQNVKWIRVHRD